MHLLYHFLRCSRYTKESSLLIENFTVVVELHIMQVRCPPTVNERTTTKINVCLSSSISSEHNGKSPSIERYIDEIYPELEHNPFNLTINRYVPNSM